MNWVIGVFGKSAADFPNTLFLLPCLLIPTFYARFCNTRILRCPDHSNRMFRRTYFLALTSFLLLACLPSQAQIQRERVFFEGQFGTSVYSGERGVAGSNRLTKLVNGLGPSGSLALGYRLWDSFDLVGEVSVSSYDGITEPVLGLKAIDPGESSIYHTALSGTGRFRFLPSGVFEPFLLGGFGLTVGKINGSYSKGYGPILGLGVGVPLGRITVYGSASQHYVFPNQGIDLAGTGRLPDVLSSLKFGIQYRLQRKIPKIGHVQISGPHSLDKNVEGLFQASTDLDPLEYAARWDFGDGVQASGFAVHHSFEKPGEYSVRVTVSNARGSSTFSMDVRVDPVFEPVVLHSVSVLPNTIIRGERVSFTPVIRGTELTCRWTFGDGQSSDECETSHVFVRAGSYKVILIASNPHHSAHSTQVITVQNDACEQLPSLSAVFFRSNSSELTLEMRQILRDNMATASACVARIIEVVGRALDNERNAKTLASERAAQVFQYYRNLGISSNRIEVSEEIVSAFKEVEGLPWSYRTVTSALVQSPR